jgi:hypothetical protein
MKKFSILFIAIVLIGVAAQAGFAQDGKELVAKTVRALETAPLDKETIKMRGKALEWIIETPDVTIGLCGGTVALFTDKKYKYNDDLFAVYNIGMAAFKLENPGKASDEKAAQFAGVETVLKTYEAILKDKPKTKSETLDNLLAKRNSGELAALIGSVDCSNRS